MSDGNSASQTEFLQAIKANDRDTALALLDHDPSLVETEAGEVSPAMLATYCGNDDLAKDLLQRGSEADVFVLAALGFNDRLDAHLAANPGAAHAYSADGWTALHLAGHFGRTAAASVLVKRGADLAARSRNRNGNSPLHAALAGRQSETAHVLLDHGSDATVADSQGWTPLHLAADSGDLTMVRALLGRGANVDATNGDAQTATDLAKRNGHEAVVQVLRDRHSPG